MRGNPAHLLAYSPSVNAIKEILPPTPHSVYTLKRRWLGTKLYWCCQLLGWGLVVFVQLVAFLVQPDEGVSLFLEFQYLLFLITTGISVSHLMRIVLLRFRDRRFGWKKLIIATTLWSYYASIGMSGITFFVLVTCDPNANSANEKKPCYSYPEFINLTIGVWLTFMCWSFFYFGGLAFRQYQASSLKLLQMDSALKEAKLRALKAQVNPHFLFNSLNTVRAMIPHDLDAPRNAVTTLADFLRASLTSDDKPTVPFSEELEVVQNYLAMEKLRLEERLQVDMRINPVSNSWPIPPFLFQTVIENAVKYGVARYEGGGSIRITGDINDRCLVLTVINSGKIDERRISTGLGIRNSKDRLALLYGPRASLTLFQSGVDEVTAKIVIPFYSADDDKDY